MHIPEFLLQALVYLSAAVIAVPLFKRLGLGSVLGYLVAGVVIGPFGLKLIPDVESVLQISEFGVVLLLFLVGLELNPKRLWEMRHSIFGLGGLQVLATVVIGSAISKLFGITWPVAIVIGMAVSMSSTAIALQILEERSLMKTSAGQAAFAVSLFQDLAVVPLMLILALLAPQANDGPLLDWAKIGKAIALIITMVVAAQFLLKPLLRLIAKTKMREIFIACALLLIVGSACLTASVGLSLAFGSFLAGVMLAESEYRIELEVDISPFKGLLLGLFFMAVGMSIDVQLILEQPLLIIGLAILAVTIKFFILRALGLFFKLCKGDGWVFAITISQVGEFAFVLSGIALTSKLLSAEQAGLLNAVVAFSMLSTPLLMLLYARFVAPTLSKKSTPKAAKFDEKNTVIIAGVGRFGQVIARVLQAKKLSITLIDVDPNQLELLARFGWKTHYGDVRRPDVLEAAGIEQATVLVIAIDDPEAALDTVKFMQQHYPKVKLVVRAKGRVQAYDLINLGVETIRETFDSSIRAAEKTMIAAGVATEEAVVSAKAFAQYDEMALHEIAPLRGDESKMIAAAQNSRQELTRLLNKEKPADAPTATIEPKNLNTAPGHT